MNWTESRYTRSDYRLGTGTAYGTLAGSSALSVTLTSNSFSNDVLNNTGGNNLPDQTRNLKIPANTGTSTTADPVVTSLGGRAGERGVMLYHASSVAGRPNRQEVTISFSRPVRGLAFWITDIDTLGAPAYSDRVELTSSPVLTRTQALDGLTGLGTAPAPASNPWQRAADANVGENSSGAQVRVEYPVNSDLSSVKLTYWNATGGAQYHRIFIGNMTFSALGC